MTLVRNKLPRCANCWVSDPGNDANNGWGDGSGLGHESGGAGLGSRGNSALNDPRVSRFTEAQQRGILNSGLGFAGNMLGTAAGDVSRYYKQLDYSRNQQRIKDEYAARLAAEKGMLAQVQMGPNYDEYAADLARVHEGKLGKLAAKGYDVSDMRATHHGGGMLGGMFGWGNNADDVQTISETESKLNGATNMGYSPLGFFGTVAAPMVGQKLAEVTRSPVAGMVGGTATSRAATSVGPDVPKGVSAGLTAAGFLGVPGTAQLGQMYGLMDKAANLNYAGYTGSKNRPDDDYEESGGNWWPNLLG